VLDHLGRARQRIRLLDVGTGTLGLIAATLLYTMVMVVLDRRFDLTPLTRQLALVGYGIFALAYSALAIVRPLARRVNPYYAAREVERVVPEAKNSIVNWLDLQNQTLPPAVRAALAQRAARDLAQADLEAAISGRRTLWMGGITAALALVVFLLLVSVGFPQFRSLVNRTFTPFSSGGILQRTHLQVIRPQGGDTVVSVGKPVSIAVEVEGWVPAPEDPAALKLLFRYSADDPYEDLLLEPEGVNTWAATLPTTQVRNGFFYKVTGGDDATPEYRVTVRSAPLLTGVNVTYHYRPYVGWPDDSSQDANLEALRGTEVVVVAHTNRTVKSGQVHLDGSDGSKRDVPGETVPEDSQALRARFVLDQSGKYCVWFTSTEDEKNADPKFFDIKVLPDKPPQVELAKPGADITLPANGTLSLEGLATDDFGLTQITLRLKWPGKETVLRPRPYRKDKSFRFPDGTYPKTLEYKDFVALERLTDEHDAPVRLERGDILEYWLEALDTCDYPDPKKPNVGESKHFKVMITDPIPEQRQAQERAQAARDQQEHNKQQDKDFDKKSKENQEKAGQKPEQGQDGDKPREGGKSAEGQNKDKEEEIKKALDQLQQEERDAMKGGKKDDPRQVDKGENKKDPGDNQPGQSAGGKEGQQHEPGQAKPDGHPKDGQQKPEGGLERKGGQPPDQDKPQGGMEKKPDGGQQSAQPGEKPEKGAAKNEGQQGENKGKPGEARDAGGIKDGQQPQAGAPKGEGQPQPDQPQGANKGQPAAQQEAGGAKTESHPGGKPEKGEARNAGRAEGKEDMGQAKNEGGAKDGPKAEAGADKGAGQGKPEQVKGESKGRGQEQANSGEKPPAGQADQKEARGEAKDAGQGVSPQAAAEKKDRQTGQPGAMKEGLPKEAGQPQTSQAAAKGDHPGEPHG
jgi:hypothetical protein